MAEKSVLQDLQTNLADFEGFLKTNVGTIRTAFQALHSLFPQVDELLDKLIKLMNDIQTEVQSLDISKIQGVEQVTNFTTMLTNLLNTLKGLLPSDQKAIEDVLGVANIVGELPQLGGEVKDKVIQSIQAIIGYLKQIKGA